MLHTLAKTTRSVFVGAAIALLLGACGPLLERTYRIDVRQGNYVTQTMLAQLSPGMTEEQVRFIMGSPILVDPFHAGRWDYIYRFTPGRGNTEDRRITLLFEQGKLMRVEGDVTAAPSTSVAAESAGTPRVVEITNPDSKKK